MAYGYFLMMRVETLFFRYALKFMVAKIIEL